MPEIPDARKADLPESTLPQPASVSVAVVSSYRKFFLYATVPVAILLVLLIFNAHTLSWIKEMGASITGFSVNGAEYFSVGFAVIGGVIMLILALSFLPDYDRARLALMLELSGAGAGWILGMFFSPTSQSEQQTFVNAKTALVGVVSGYLLSKIQSLFDKAVAEGNVLNTKSLVLGLTFFIPLALSTAAVYNVRAYKDLNVIITPGKSGELIVQTENGKTEYKLALSKSAAFLAEARFSTDTSVRWSVDPPEGHGTIDPHSGDYKAPTELPNDQNVDIVAMSLSDKTRVGRLSLALIKPTMVEAEKLTPEAKPPISTLKTTLPKDKK